jgi:chemotaxis protein MotA
MKANTGIGIGIGLGCILLSVIMEGGNPAALIGIPPFLIVVGGTLGATFASVTLEQIKLIPALYKKAIGGNAFEPQKAIELMVGLAEKARREGLLALEGDLEGVDDDFTRKGIQLVVDGKDSEIVKQILHSEMDGMAQRHRQNAALFTTAGGFAPTLGIIGTVLSLVHVLENLSDPGGLGKSIASAFIATLYGVGSANIIYLPVGNKLKALAAEELNYREMQLEAILAIQAGDNPRTIGEKLETYIPPAARLTEEQQQELKQAA